MILPGWLADRHPAPIQSPTKSSLQFQYSASWTADLVILAPSSSSSSPSSFIRSQHTSSLPATSPVDPSLLQRRHNFYSIPFFRRHGAARASSTAPKISALELLGHWG